MLIDTHTHLNDAKFGKDIDAVVERARQAGLAVMINVGSDLISSRQAVQQAQLYPEVYAAVGVHPHDASAWSAEVKRDLLQLATQAKVVAWGEIGLDYHYDFSPRTEQKEVFLEQLQLAHQLELPVIIHDRDAHQDVWNMLSKWRGKLRGVIHCYSGSYEMAKDYIDMGFYVAIGGTVTFKNARRLPDIVRQLPLENLVLETDCPYLAPVPYRGKRNEPAYVLKVAEKVAELKGLPLDEVCRQTSKNAQSLFGLSGVYG